jgi:riboflavin biosynthesis pyrimidine reductase
MAGTLSAFERLHAEPAIRGSELPLPPALAELYGTLSFPRPTDRPYVISNFVSTIDGVVSLGIPGKSGGGEISGFNRHDRALMGLLRAVSDAVVVGAGTLRSVPKHLWTAEYAYPELAEAFQDLRHALGLRPTPLNVILTGSGQVDLGLPVFASGKVDVLIVTVPAGLERLRSARMPAHVSVHVPPGVENGRLTAAGVLTAIAAQLQKTTANVLLEGGPQVMADFFGEQVLDELFLTVAPQVAGRDVHASPNVRPSLVSGRLFAPEQPVWGTLASISRADNHLFLRYRFPRGE